MVSWSGHVLPVIVVIAVWFLATGLIAWLDHRERGTFARTLVASGLVGVGGLTMVLGSMQFATIAGVYASFVGALLIWAWHEISFLIGAVTGPRRVACPPGARGVERFGHAAATMAWHELALALTALTLLVLTWDAPNQLGAMVFLLLLAMRLSTKLNLFAGVPNDATDILPPHLAYLKTYFGPRRFTPILALSLAACVALAAWLGSLAFAAPKGSAEAAGASLLFALAALGVLEHLFLALPWRDGALWRWALPAQQRHKIKSLGGDR